MEVTSCLIAGLGVADQSLISFILLVNSRDRKDSYAEVTCLLNYSMLLDRSHRDQVKNQFLLENCVSYLSNGNWVNIFIKLT